MGNNSTRNIQDYRELQSHMEGIGESYGHSFKIKCGTGDIYPILSSALLLCWLNAGGSSELCLASHFNTQSQLEYKRRVEKRSLRQLF